MHAFHLKIPIGAKTLTLDYQLLSDVKSLGDHRINVQWQRLLLYPAGLSVSDIPVQADLTLPPGFRAFSALDTVTSGSTIDYAPTSLEKLVDAPVWASTASRRVILSRVGAQPVYLDLMANDEANLAFTSDELRHLSSMLVQTERVFGAAPFRHYDVLTFMSGEPRRVCRRLQLLRVRLRMG